MKQIVEDCHLIVTYDSRLSPTQGELYRAIEEKGVEYVTWMDKITFSIDLTTKEDVTSKDE